MPSSRSTKGMAVLRPVESKVIVSRWVASLQSAMASTQDEYWYWAMGTVSEETKLSVGNEDR